MCLYSRKFFHTILYNDLVFLTAMIYLWKGLQMIKIDIIINFQDAEVGLSMIWPDDIVYEF